jgi:sensor histidine kinase YesM
VIRDIIFAKSLNWLKALAAILLGLAAMVFLLQHYGYPFSLTLIDASIVTLLLLIGLTMLENVFRFYVPKSSEWWLVILLSVMLSVVLTFLGEYLMAWLMANDFQYLEMVKYSYPIRLTFFSVMFLSWSAILVFYGKVEDQIKTRERQEKIAQMAKEAELFHLRQQLQPHFLFNSLNSISALVKVQPDKAREMVLQLADFLRATIKKDDKKWLSVEEEKDYLGLYLEIEKVRFGHRLSVVFDVDENSLSMKLPPLMVQPLLENAIKHGLYGITGEVQISLFFAKIGNDLLVSISNPFDPTMGGNPTGEGFGLESVKRRLYLLFGRTDLLATQANENEFLVSLKIPQYYVQSTHSG